MATNRHLFTPTSAFRGGSRHHPASSKKLMEKFSFPLLEAREILTCMEELEIPIALHELTECDKHVASVRRMLESLVEQLLGVRKEEIHQPVFGPLQNLAWPQLHEHSIPELAFWRACARLFHICGVSDFSMHDYTKPTTKRLRKLLSAAINFAKFKEERLEIYHKITIPRDELLERHAQLASENEQLQAQLDATRASSAEQRQEITAIDEQCTVVQGQVNALNKEQAALRSESQQLKKDSGELKEQLLELKATQDATHAEIKKLESQVVHSPERVRREMHESQRALQQERREGEAAEQAALTAATSSKVLDEAVGRIHEATAECNAISDATRKWHDNVNDLKLREGELAATTAATAEKEEAALSAERQRARLEERLRHLRQQAETRSLAASDALDETHARLLEAQRKQRGLTTHVQDINHMAQALRGSMAERTQLHEARMAEMAAVWRRLEAAVEAHHQTLLEAMLPAQLEEDALAGLPPPPAARNDPFAPPIPAC